MARAMVRLTSKAKFSSSADTVNSPIAILDMAESLASRIIFQTTSPSSRCVLEDEVHLKFEYTKK